MAFSWFRRLDVGEGQSVDLEECPRKKLQGQLIKYLTPVSSNLSFSPHAISCPFCEFSVLSRHPIVHASRSTGRVEDVTGTALSKNLPVVSFSCPGTLSIVKVLRRLGLWPLQSKLMGTSISSAPGNAFDTIGSVRRDGGSGLPWSRHDQYHLLLQTFLGF
jgi:hypothetical protein